MFEVASIYPWIKAFHVIAIVTWMAAMFAMTRLLVAAEADPHTAQAGGFERLAQSIRAWMNPAMTATLVFGTTLVVLEPGWLRGQGWLMAKLPLVFGMFAVHGVLVRSVRDLLQGKDPRSSTYQRTLATAPFILLALIAVLAVVKPF
ncbi:MAG: CopD family protein [Gemmatimonadaceae bacterium]|nr:CopD family protein [Gloeobacterales cyanobacterium ES-bin-141]